VRLAVRRLRASHFHSLLLHALRHEAGLAADGASGEAEQLATLSEALCAALQLRGPLVPSDDDDEDSGASRVTDVGATAGAWLRCAELMFCELLQTSTVGGGWPPPPEKRMLPRLLAALRHAAAARRAHSALTAACGRLRACGLPCALRQAPPSAEGGTHLSSWEVALQGIGGTALPPVHVSLRGCALSIRSMQQSSDASASPALLPPSAPPSDVPLDWLPFWLADAAARRSMEALAVHLGPGQAARAPGAGAGLVVGGARVATRPQRDGGVLWEGVQVTAGGANALDALVAQLR
jgi:hypothetical protein